MFRVRLCFVVQEHDQGAKPGCRWKLEVMDRVVTGYPSWAARGAGPRLGMDAAGTRWMLRPKLTKTETAEQRRRNGDAQPCMVFC